jgi:hypothetical protein
LLHVNAQDQRFGVIAHRRPPAQHQTVPVPRAVDLSQAPSEHTQYDRAVYLLGCTDSAVARRRGSDTGRTRHERSESLPVDNALSYIDATPGGTRMRRTCPLRFRWIYIGLCSSLRHDVNCVAPAASQQTSRSPQSQLEVHRRPLASQHRLPP